MCMCGFLLMLSREEAHAASCEVRAALPPAARVYHTRPERAAKPNSCRHRSHEGEGPLPSFDTPAQLRAHVASSHVTGRPWWGEHLTASMLAPSRKLWGSLCLHCGHLLSYATEEEAQSHLGSCEPAQTALAAGKRLPSPSFSIRKEVQAANPFECMHRSHTSFDESAAAAAAVGDAVPVRPCFPTAAALREHVISAHRAGRAWWTEAQEQVVFGMCSCGIAIAGPTRFEAHVTGCKVLAALPAAVKPRVFYRDSDRLALEGCACKHPAHRVAGAAAAVFANPAALRAHVLEAHLPRGAEWWREGVPVEHTQNIYSMCCACGCVANHISNTEKHDRSCLMLATEPLQPRFLTRADGPRK